MKTRAWSLVLLAALAWAAGAETATRPNILLLLADDMGYGDLGCYGSPIKTPNLDQLAGQGMRFTDFYAGAPNCSPSRAALMTGRIAARTGLYNYIPPENGLHLPADEITIAKLLQNAGYATGLFGKWHLSRLDNSPQPKPAAYGFDYTFCTHNNAMPSHQDPDNFYRNGEALGKLTGYSCDLVADEAIGWLGRRSADAPPFFAYVAFHEPHQKLASPPDLVAEYQAADHENPVYAANIANLDRAIGRLLKSLDEHRLAENTFVFFASDNGPWREGSQGPLRGKKSDIWDGGIRAPGMVRWPGHIQPGTTMAEAAGVVDMLPTLCAMADIQPPQDRAIDGTDLTPLFAAPLLVLLPHHPASGPAHRRPHPRRIHRRPHGKPYPLARQRRHGLHQDQHPHPLRALQCPQRHRPAEGPRRRRIRAPRIHETRPAEPAPRSHRRRRRLDRGPARVYAVEEEGRSRATGRQRTRARCPPLSAIFRTCN
jgi:arylsulfatase A